MITSRTADFFVRSATIETTRSYMGNLQTFLVRSAETDNRLFFLEVRAQPGAEAPPHLHYEQDEVFYILEGEMEIYCGDQVRTARAGDAVFLPRQQAHAFYFLSPTVRFLAIVQPGTGLDGYFEKMSTPATSMELPKGTTTYAASDSTSAAALVAQYGTKFLSPAETAELLPHYPGFGSRVRSDRLSTS